MKLKFLILSILVLLITKSYSQEKVYYNQTEFGILFGNSVETWNGERDKRRDFSMVTFHGVKISRHHVVGMSAGFDQYEDLSVIPIAIGWRGFLGRENKPQLIGGFDFGGGSALFEKKEVTEWYESWYKGGVMISPSIGVKLPAKKGKTSLTMSIAYKRQELGFFMGYFDQGNNSQPLVRSRLLPGYSSMTETSYLFHSLVARMGFSF
jgi:hypothetical protein